jgi:hypothetical protein
MERTVVAPLRLFTMSERPRAPQFVSHVQRCHPEYDREEDEYGDKE